MSVRVGEAALKKVVINVHTGAFRFRYLSRLNDVSVRLGRVWMPFAVYVAMVNHARLGETSFRDVVVDLTLRLFAASQV